MSEKEQKREKEENIVETLKEEPVDQPKVRFLITNLNVYEEIVLYFKSQIAKLVQRGSMSPNTAQRITEEFEYNAFSRFVHMRIDDGKEELK